MEFHDIFELGKILFENLGLVFNSNEGLIDVGCKIEVRCKINVISMRELYQNLINVAQCIKNANMYVWYHFLNIK